MKSIATLLLLLTPCFCQLDYILPFPGVIYGGNPRAHRHPFLYGHGNLAEELNSLPSDQQPKWFINWKHYNEMMKPSQHIHKLSDYKEYKPSSFIEEYYQEPNDEVTSMYGSKPRISSYDNYSPSSYKGEYQVNVPLLFNSKPRQIRYSKYTPNSRYKGDYEMNEPLIYDIKPSRKSCSEFIYNEKNNPLVYANEPSSYNKYYQKQTAPQVYVDQPSGDSKYYYGTKLNDPLAYKNKPSNYDEVYKEQQDQLINIEKPSSYNEFYKEETDPLVFSIGSKNPLFFYKQQKDSQVYDNSRIKSPGKNDEVFREEKDAYINNAEQKLPWVYHEDKKGSWIDYKGQKIRVTYVNEPSGNKQYAHEKIGPMIRVVKRPNRYNKYYQKQIDPLEYVDKSGYNKYNEGQNDSPTNVQIPWDYNRQQNDPEFNKTLKDDFYEVLVE